MNAKVQQSIEEWTTSKKLTGVSVCSQYTNMEKTNQNMLDCKQEEEEEKYITTSVDVPISITTIRPNPQHSTQR